MKCPHCQTEIHGNPQTLPMGNDLDGQWATVRHTCPSCRRIIVFIVCAKGFNGAGAGEFAVDVKKVVLGYPRVSSRPAAPPEVPEDFASDYREAALVLLDSPKASAALGRRCLQHILREKAGVSRSDLAHEIEEVLARNLLPSHLAEAVDAIRNLGNFAAHPMKSKSSGEILPVEPGEAEWTLDVLDGLFDFFFVQPELLKKRRSALNAKLAAAGKPPMK
jgi:hypothetical protein